MIRFWRQGIIIQNIHEDNFLLFDFSFYSFFDADVTYESERTKQMK